MDIVTIFCEIDDFCRQFESGFNQKLIASQTKQRNRVMKLQFVGSDDDCRLFSYFRLSQLQDLLS